MSRRKRTKEELLAELDTLDLPEETLATFRRVVPKRQVSLLNQSNKMDREETASFSLDINNSSGQPLGCWSLSI